MHVPSFFPETDADSVKLEDEKSDDWHHLAQFTQQWHSSFDMSQVIIYLSHSVRQRWNGLER